MSFILVIPNDNILVVVSLFVVAVFLSPDVLLEYFLLVLLWTRK